MGGGLPRASEPGPERWFVQRLAAPARPPASPLLAAARRRSPPLAAASAVCLFAIAALTATGRCRSHRRGAMTPGPQFFHRKVLTAGCPHPVAPCPFTARRPRRAPSSHKTPPASVSPDATEHAPECVFGCLSARPPRSVQVDCSRSSTPWRRSASLGWQSVC